MNFDCGDEIEEKVDYEQVVYYFVDQVDGVRLIVRDEGDLEGHEDRGVDQEGVGDRGHEVFDRRVRHYYEEQRFLLLFF